MKRLALAIIHAAHRPERVPLYDRLVEELQLAPHHWHDPLNRGVNPHVERWYAETTRAKHFVWMPLTLDWFAAQAAQGAEYAVTLQDDVEVSPAFWPTLHALLEGRPDDVICLDCAHPGARVAFVEGKPGYQTYDGMVGIGWAAPMRIVEDFRQWRIEEARPDALLQITEDMLFGQYCMARELPIFCPVPSMLDHDLNVGSTNAGFDDHLFRKPQVTWKEIDRSIDPDCLRSLMLTPAWWAQPVDHVGRFYDNAFELLPLSMRDKALAQRLVEVYRAIETPEKYARFFPRASALVV